MSDLSDPSTRTRFQRLRDDLRRDAGFRVTFLAAVVLPALCFAGVIGWIFLSIARG